MASEPQPGDLRQQFFLSMRHWWMTGDIVGVARFNKNLKLCTGIGLIFVFQPEYQTIKHSNFCHSALFCLDFLQAECHWRVNYVYAFSPLYFFPPPPFSLSPDVCERANACWCECVCLQTNVCRLCFSFEHLFDVAVYLFISLPAKALSRRLGLQRIGRALLWVPSISEEPLWRMNQWPRLPIAHQLEAEGALGDFRFLRRCSVTRRGLCFITTLPGWISVCIACKATISSVARKNCFTLVSQR